MANIYFGNFEQVKKLTLKRDVWVGFWATYPCHPCIFYPIKTPFRRNPVLPTGHHPRQWSPCYLVLSMLLAWHYTTQWSSGTAPVLL